MIERTRRSRSSYGHNSTGVDAAVPMELMQAWMSALKGARLEVEQDLKAWRPLSDPVLRKKFQRVMETVTHVQNLMKRLPPALQAEMGAALHKVLTSLAGANASSDLDATGKQATNVLDATRDAVLKTEQVRELIGQLRSLAKSLDPGGAAALGALATAAEQALNRATSPGELDALKSLLEKGLDIGKRLRSTEPGSPEHSSLLRSIGALVSDVKRIGGESGAQAPGGADAEGGLTIEAVGGIEFEQEALTPAQIDAVGAQAEPLPQA